MKRLAGLFLVIVVSVPFFVTSCGSRVNFSVQEFAYNQVANFAGAHKSEFLPGAIRIYMNSMYEIPMNLSGEDLKIEQEFVASANAFQSGDFTGGTALGQEAVNLFHGLK